MNTSATNVPLPLAGIRVIEFSHVVMGPVCGMILADLGAEVIKVEPPGGDKTRTLPGLGIGFFRSFNRNKKSVVLDLDTQDGRDTAKQLIGQSDIVLENFRPGRMAKLGLDYAALAERFPRIIYIALKGFLPGPYEDRLASDEVVQNMAGLTYMTGPEGRPLRAGSSVNDIMGAMFGAIGAMAALQERQRTGTGQEIQSGLFENCTLLAAQHIQQFLMTGERPPPMPSRISAWSVYDTFPVADGEQLFVAAISDKQFVTLCAVIGRDDLARNPELGTNAQRVAVRPHLLSQLGDTLRHHSLRDLMPKLEAAGIPYAPVLRPDQLLDDPHLVQSGAISDLLAEDGSTTKTVLLPLLLGGRRPGVRLPLPRVGEHSAEVLSGLRSSTHR